MSKAVWLLTLDRNGPLAHCTWGDFVAQQVVWRDNNPTYLAENLEGTNLVPDERRRQSRRTGRGRRRLRRGRVDDWADERRSSRTGPRRRGRPLHLPTSTARALTRGRTGSATSSASSPGLTRRSGSRSSARGIRRALRARGILGVGLAVQGEPGHARVRLPGRGLPRTASRPPAVARSNVTTPAGCHLTIDLGPSHQAQQLVFGDNETAGWTTKQVEIGPCS